MRLNAHQQPIGPEVEAFTPGSTPDIQTLVGSHVLVQPLDFDRDLQDAYTFYGPKSPDTQWTYLPIDAFQEFEDFKTYFGHMVASKDPYYLGIRDKKTDRLVGTFSLMRIDQTNRVVEMGWVLYSDQLKHTPLGTEAQYLVMQYVFETLGYRRYEWKCDSLNEPSARAAERLGFQYEGTFRRAAVYKNRSRDTKWFSMIQEDYEHMKPKFEAWLSADNFDDTGRQKVSLQDI